MHFVSNDIKIDVKCKTNIIANKASLQVHNSWFVFRDDSCRIQRTICGTKDQTWVIYMQNKFPIHCNFALTLQSLFWNICKYIFVLHFKCFHNICNKVSSLPFFGHALLFQLLTSIYSIIIWEKYLLCFQVNCVMSKTKLTAKNLF